MLSWASSTVAQQQFSDSFIEQELSRVKTDPDNTVTIFVDAPIEYVYEFLLERLDLYTEDAATVSFDHSSATRENAFSIGSQRTTKMKNGGTLLQRFIVADQFSSYAYFTDISKSTLSVPLKYSLGYYEFQEISEARTKVTVAVVYQPSSRLLGFIVRRAFNAAFSRDFNHAAILMNELYQTQSRL